MIINQYKEEGLPVFILEMAEQTGMQLAGLIIFWPKMEAF